MLKFGARYKAAVATTAKAANGEGTLRNPFDYPFETVKLPRVTATDPANGARNVPPDRGVRISFASPMNPSTFVTGTVTVLPKPTRVMTYYNEYDGALFVDFAEAAGHRLLGHAFGQARRSVRQHAGQGLPC